MYIVDFEFDGVRLTSYDSMLCRFDGAIDATETAGGKTEFVTVQPALSNELTWVATNHTEHLSRKIQIGKLNCDISDEDGNYYTEEDVRRIMRWLNRSDGYHKLYLYDENARSDWYYMAQINVDKIELGGRVYGFELTIDTNKPWATIDRNTDKEITGEDNILTLNDVSDEVGQTDVDMELTLKQSGTLTIYNPMTEQTTEFKDCVSGEKIVIDGRNHVIQSDKADIANRFNWVFPAIGNTFQRGVDDRVNNISISLPCSVAASWHENRKVGVSMWVD